MYQYDELPCGCLQAANPGDRRPMPVVVRYCYEHALADSRDTPRVQRTSIADRLAIFGSKYPLSETGLSQKERLQARLTVGMIPILVGMVGYAIWKIVQNQYTMLDAPIMVTIVALATVMSVAIVHVVRKINPRRGMNLDVFLNTLLAIILASSFEHAINEEWTLGYLAFIILMSMASELADVPRTPEVVPAFDPPFQQPPFHQGPPAA